MSVYINHAVPMYAYPDPGRAQSAKQRETLTERGMLLRDYLAAHAPFGVQEAMTLAKGAGHEGLTGPELMELVAHMRYAYADAMLAERVKP